MARFIIRGGRKLSGLHTPPGNKNAALPMLAACLLTDEPVCLQNLPLIEDVHTSLRILEDLGATVDLSGHQVTVCAKGIRKRRISPELCSRIRSSILFAGPLVARHGAATIHPPGGDLIGRRPLDTHFSAFRKLGVSIQGRRAFVFSCARMRGARILLEEASVTATENILMAASLAEGETVLFNAACEPHVQDLCRMLNRMGAQISGLGTNRLTIQGVERLSGVEHRIEADYIEAASFLAAATVTGGHLEVADVSPEAQEVMRPFFGKIGVRWTPREPTGLSTQARPRLVICNDFGAAIPKIEDGPWPNFPSDLMSVAIVLATQSKGTALFFEKMFESRMYFVDRLIEMGARIVQCDPHRIIVSGPSRLRGTHLSSPDIRAGMALLISSLCAKGESVIDNAQIIDRGYERVEEELRRLGADIEREK